MSKLIQNFIRQEGRERKADGAVFMTEVAFKNLDDALTMTERAHKISYDALAFHAERGTASTEKMARSAVEMCSEAHVYASHIFTEVKANSESDVEKLSYLSDVKEKLDHIEASLPGATNTDEFKI